MNRKNNSYCYLLVLLTICSSLYGQPKLVVGIVVDQMRYDYIERYWNKFGNDGFKRLVQEGFFCKNTHYNYVPTYTAPGHASIFAGSGPSVHGIIGNDWYVKTLKKQQYCAADEKEKTVGSTSKAGEMSPRNLLVDNICDELRKKNNNRSKVIGIALKDRASIFPAGHHPNAAYWYDGKTGNWITSTYYTNILPAWVETFNQKKLAEKFLEQDWKTILPIEQYTESLPDNNPYEAMPDHLKFLKPVFPYHLPIAKKAGGLKVLMATPFGNTFTKDFAKEAITMEELGKDDVTDMLTISFSSTDIIGHQFGPRSVEIEDTYLRLDKDIADFLHFLDTQVGKEQVLVFLTADHGAAENPGYLMDKQIPAGYFDDGKMKKKFKKEFSPIYGDSLMMDYVNQQVYLNDGLIQRNKWDKKELENKIAAFLTKQEGVAFALTGEQLRKESYTDSMYAKVQYGYSPERSGDVALMLKPNWLDYQRTGTSHGSCYSYDTHVPLIWYGWKVQTGESNTPDNITDIVATLAELINIPKPNGCTGKPIVLKTE